MSGFNAERVADTMRAEGSRLTPNPAQAPALLRMLPPGDALSTLIQPLLASVPAPVPVDGRRTLAEAMDESAAVLAADVDRDELGRRTVAIAERTVELGVLRPSRIRSRG